MNGSMLLGQTRIFRAIGKYSDGTFQQMPSPIWASSTSAIAIDQDGEATAQLVGPSVISATDPDNQLTVGRATVKVIPALLRSITVTPEITSLTVGVVQQFVATGTYSDNTTKIITEDVIWTSSDSNALLISSTGSAKAKLVPLDGPVAITAELGNISTTFSLILNPPTLLSIQVIATSQNINIGSSQSFVARANYSDGTSKIITNEVQWTSSAPSVATVNNLGIVSPVVLGTTTIRATFGEIFGELTATVIPAALASIQISPINQSIKINNSQQFSAMGFYSDGTSRDVTSESIWKSSLVAIATINSATGLATGVSAGTTSISATLDNINASVDLKTLATQFKQISSGRSHILAIKLDGTLWAWGTNTFGQFGDGTTSSSLLPKQIGIATNWVQVSAGDGYSLALKSDGTLWAAGKNNYGQIGDNTSVTKSTLTFIGSGYSSISAGLIRSFGVKANGTLWAWGYATDLTSNTPEKISLKPKQHGADTDWSKVSSGGDWVGAIKTNNTLWVSSIEPQNTNTFNIVINPLSQMLSDCKNFYVSFSDAKFAIKTDGSLYAWGSNLRGQLGDGTKVDKTTPVNIPGSWNAIGVGEFHTLGIKTDGSLWAWGDNVAGKLGKGYLGTLSPTDTSNYSPMQVGTEKGWLAVSGGYNSSIALKSDNSTWVWGSSINGMLGGVPQPYVSTPTPI